MRFAYLDALRGMAVVWMIIFHFSYDLKMFHHLDWDFNQGFWFAFPRIIAFTFLFCVGISLHLTHQGKIKGNSLKKRSVKLALSALAVSLGTYVMFPSQWIFFGTLHCIFVGSILGALLVNHRKLSVFLLILFLILQYGLQYDIKWVSSIIQKPSLDFIPIYPWFWAILLGIILAPYLSRMSFLNRVKPNKFLNFLGQHSLKIYLLHQPVLFGLIWAYTNLVVR